MADVALSNSDTEGFRITDHAMDMALQRGVSLPELRNALANRSFVLSNSKKDPESDRYVLPFKDLRVIWEPHGEEIVVLTIFRR